MEQEQKITIQGGTGLAKDEVEKMVKDAEIHAGEDKKRKEQVEAKNIADGLCYTAEKSLRDAGDKVPADVKKEIEDKVKDIRDVLQTADSEVLKQKTQELSTSLQKIGQYMYSQQQPGTQQGPTPNSGGTNPAGPGDGSNPNPNEPVEGEVVE